MVLRIILLMENGVGGTRSRQASYVCDEYFAMVTCLCSAHIWLSRPTTTNAFIYFQIGRRPLYTSPRDTSVCLSLTRAQYLFSAHLLRKNLCSVKCARLHSVTWWVLRKGYACVPWTPVKREHFYCPGEFLHLPFQPAPALSRGTTILRFSQ